MKSMSLTVIHEPICTGTAEPATKTTPTTTVGSPDTAVAPSSPTFELLKGIDLSSPALQTANHGDHVATMPQGIAPPPPQRVFYDGCMRSATNVFIAGLPLDFDDTRFKALFAGYGEIINCKVLIDVDSGISKGIGFVRYRDPASARKAIDNMNGKKLSVSAARPLFMTLALDDGETTAVECERVYIRNVPAYVKEPELMKAFEKYGEILECRVLQGVAFIKFKTIEMARNAVENAQGTRPFGSTPKPVMVRFAETQEARQHRQNRIPATAMQRYGQQQQQTGVPLVQFVPQQPEMCVPVGYVAVPVQPAMVPVTNSFVLQQPSKPPVPSWAKRNSSRRQSSAASAASKSSAAAMEASFSGSSLSVDGESSSSGNSGTCMWEDPATGMAYTTAPGNGAMGTDGFMMAPQQMVPYNPMDMETPGYYAPATSFMMAAPEHMY